MLKFLDQVRKPTLDLPVETRRKMWFKPTISYSPSLPRESFWKGKSGVQYKLAANYSSGGTHYSHPTVDGTYGVLENMFNRLGAGLCINKKFSSDGNHAFALEIINGNTNFRWPTHSSYSFKPGLDFDLIWDGETNGDSTQWQIVQMDLNFAYRDQFVEDPIGFKSFETRKLTVDNRESDYTFRGSFDKSSHYDLMGQVSKQNPVRHIKAVATENIDAEAILYSITMVVWAGKTGGLVKRNAIIANLKSTYKY